MIHDSDCIAIWRYGRYHGRLFAWIGHARGVQCISLGASLQANLYSISLLPNSEEVLSHLFAKLCYASSH